MPTIWSLCAALLVVLVVQLGLVLHRSAALFAAHADTIDEYSWVGGVYNTGASFRISAPRGTTRQFVISTVPELLQPAHWVYNQSLVFATGGDAGGNASWVSVETLSLTAAPLPPNAILYYGQLDGRTITWSGSFSTPPAPGTPFNFRVATAGCALTGSKHPIFERIVDRKPFMFLHLGDMHYKDQGQPLFSALSL